MLRTITPAADSPISLVEAKAHLRVDFDEDDAVIEALTLAATEFAQNLTQKRFVSQVVEWVSERGWNSGCLELPIAPVEASGVASIMYVNWDGVQQTLDPSLYVVKTSGQSVKIIPSFGSIWPVLKPSVSEPVVIRFEVGVSPEDVSPIVKTAIKMILEHWYENRGAVVVDSRAVADEVPMTAREILISENWNH